MAYGNLKADNLIYADSTTGADTVVPLEHVGNKASLDSPVFTGTPTAPTFGASTTAQIATIEYVDTEVAGVDLSAKADLIGATFTGDVNIGSGSTEYDLKLVDNGHIYIGDISGAHLNLVHNDTGNSLVISTAPLYTRGTELFFQEEGDSNKEWIHCLPAGSVELSYDDSKRFETTDVGVNVTGTVDATGAITSSAGVLGVGDALLAGNQTWTGVQSGDIHDDTGDAALEGAGWAIDFNHGNNQKVTLDAANLLNVLPINQTPGQSGSIFITQPASPLNLGWHGDWKWAGGSAAAPSLTQTGGATDRLDYVILAANNIHAVLTADVK